MLLALRQITSAQAVAGPAVRRAAAGKPDGKAAAASGRETKEPAGAAAAGEASVTGSEPTRCDIGAPPAATM